MQYKVGDQIDIRVEVTNTSDFGWGVVRARTVGYDGPWTTSYRIDELDAGKLVPREIKVGDRVRWAIGSSSPCVVEAVAGNDVWLRVSSGEHYTSHLPEVELVR